MAEEYNDVDPFKSCEEEEEEKGQGCFGFMKKKEEREEEEKEEKKKKGSLFEKLRGSSSDSSSDDEEVGEGGKKKKNKKGLKEKIKEKLHHDGEDTKILEEDKGEAPRPARTATPIAGFFDNVKEKLPGHPNKKDEARTSAVEEGGKEEKGMLGKLMDKLPGYHKEEIDNNTPPAHH